MADRMAYRGPHEVLPGGDCRHRFANRTWHVIRGCPVAAIATERARIEAVVEGEGWGWESVDRVHLLAIVRGEP